MIYVFLGIALILLLAGWLIVGHKGFTEAFGRQTEVPLDEIALEKTHYAPYRQTLLDGIAAYRALPWQDLHVTAADGTSLCGRFCDRGSSRTAILIHGYHAVPENNFPVIAPRLYQAGFNLFVPFLRAHGKSGGTYCTFGEKERSDLLDWLDLLDPRDGSREFFLYGVSMGGFIVAASAPALEKYPVRALVLDCGFANEYEEVRHRTPPLFPPFRAFVVFAIRTYAKVFHGLDLRRGDACKPLSRSRLPVFVIHGRSDTIVPFENAERLYAAAGGPKRRCFLENAEHNECLLVGGEPLVQNILDFYDTFTKIR